MSNAYPNLYHCIYHSPLGAMYMHSCGKALRALYFERQKYHQTYENPESKELQANDLEIFTQTKLWLDRYFSGQIPDFVPKLAPNGSDFAKQVWHDYDLWRDRKDSRKKSRANTSNDRFNRFGRIQTFGI